MTTKWRRTVGGVLVANSLLQVGAPLVVQAPYLARLPAAISETEASWWQLGLISQAMAEVPAPARYIGVLRSDRELDRYLAGDLWCGKPRPGDCVELVGEFSSSRTLSEAGAPGKWIIFKAQSQGAAKVTGLWTIGGSWQFVWGMVFARSAAGNLLDPLNRGNCAFGGDDNILRRCEFTEWARSPALAIRGGNRGLVDYCEWHDPMPWVTLPWHPRKTDPIVIAAAATAPFLAENGKGTNLFSTAGTGVPLRQGIRTAENTSSLAALNASWHFDFRLRHCYFRDFPDKPVPGSYHSAQNDAIEPGQNGPSFADLTLTSVPGGAAYPTQITGWFQSRWLLEYILVERHRQAAAGTIDVKVPGLTARKVTFKDCSGRFDFRWGPFSVMEDIYVLRSAGSTLSGYGHTVTRYETSGTFTDLNNAQVTPDLTFGSGTVYPAQSQPAATPVNQASQACVAREIRAKFGMGTKGGPIAAKACSAFNCTPAPAVADTATRIGCSFNGQAATQSAYQVTTADAGLAAVFVD